MTLRRALLIVAFMSVASVAWANDFSHSDSKITLKGKRLGYEIEHWCRFEIEAKNLSKDTRRYVVAILKLSDKDGKPCGEAPVFIELAPGATSKVMVPVREQRDWEAVKLVDLKIYEL